MKHLLHIRSSTANQIVLAEFGRYPLQIHFWQQILRFHNRALKLPNERLIKIALVDGMELSQVSVEGVAEGHDKGWRPNLAEFLAKQPGNLRVLHDLDVPTIVGIQKEMYLSSFLSDESHSSLDLDLRSQFVWMFTA